MLARKVLTRRDVARTLADVGVASVTIPLLRQPVMSEEGWLHLFTWNGHELHPAVTERYGRGFDVPFHAGMPTGTWQTVFVVE